MRSIPISYLSPPAIANDRKKPSSSPPPERCPAFFLRRIAPVHLQSRELGEAMIEEITLKPGDLVVEYGPGTGPFTSVLKERMPQGVEYLGIEYDRELHRNLVRRFPGLRFHHGSAEQTPEILAHHRLGPAKVVLSGLPFANMPPDLQARILESTRAALHHDGIFRTFTYLLSSLNPSTTHFHRLVSAHFHHHHKPKTVMQNFPPARVLSYSKPVQKG